MPNPTNPQSWNRYAYTFNNPLNLIDPSGHRPIIDEDEYGNPILDPDWPPKPKLSKGNNSSSEKFIFVDEFQMLPVFDIEYSSYGQVTEGGYDQHSWGGSIDGPIYPSVGGLRIQSESIYGATWISLANDLLIGGRPAYYRKFAPYTQDVYLGYTVHYDNVPQKDAVRTVTLTRVLINNTSDELVHYSVRINSGNRTVSIGNHSAIPNSSANVALPDNFTVSYSANVSILAYNACNGPCITTTNPQLNVGSTNIYVTP